MENQSFKITDSLFASQSQRLLNAIIDSLFIYILILSAGTTIVLVAEAMNNFILSSWVEEMSIPEIVFYSLLILFLYYFLTEVYFSRTVAKLITKTIVVNYDGSKPTIKMIFIRTLSRFIPLEGLSYLGSVPRGWHDVLSRTYVVQKKEFLKNKASFQNA
ncbi:putative RDD family membrane protein YckC [Flavobacterium sp. 28A]|uniref:RDD family protein n=1 Tax=Flavobacterium sp. 28A TaxID=2735895 RepID=UPI00156D9D78|nr:RDD family protein [Flavobacterium sp. 28A]NRT14098.1 putative RDD family membrane protein YckC [Flavobacterium sp. 28A]